MVDNASTESILPLKEAFKSVNFIESKENLGFAGGNNLAMQQANGKYFFLINNDTEPLPDLLERVKKAGFKNLLHCCFFYFFIPKRDFKYLIRKDFILLRAFFKRCLMEFQSPQY